MAEPYQSWNGLFLMSTEDTPVSVSGRLIADNSTSEELLRNEL